mmetsp:Transcript_10072/g.22931  ORF Transcript_10072/g.22931 Transcript_10072/m.22931 type:complete len:336 (-) Transcript_10072:102-1109(-)
MGAEQSVVKTHANRESRYLPATNPGKCVMTDPIPEDVSFDKFWAGLVQSFKEDFKLAPNYKEGGLVELNENHFVTFATHQGPNGEPLGPAAKIVYRIDHEKAEVYEESRDPIFDSLMSVGLTKVHRDPMQVEYWRQFIDIQSRRSGEVPRWYLASMLKTALDREVEVKEVQDSRIETNKKSAISVELDEFTNPDDLYEAMLECVKTQKYNFCLKSVTGITKQPSMDEKEEAFVIDLVLDGELMKKHGCGFAKFGEWPMRYFVQARKELRAITILVSHDTYEVEDLFTYVVLPEPCQVESWRFVPLRVENATVFGDEMARGIVDAVVNKNIEKARK